MNKFIFIIFLAISISKLSANPIPVYTSPDLDYLRGTIGEPISSNDYNIVENGHLRVINEIRYIHYTNPIPNLPSDEFPYYNEGEAKGRLTNLFSADVGIKRFSIGLRIPYIMYFTENLADTVRTHKLSDLLVKVGFEPFSDINSMYRFNLGLGVKFNTGDNESALPSSLGSRDYCFWMNYFS